MLKRAIMAARGEHRYTSGLSLTSALYGVGWSTPHPVPFYRRDKDPVLIVTEVYALVDECPLSEGAQYAHCTQRSVNTY